MPSSSRFFVSDLPAPFETIFKKGSACQHLSEQPPKPALPENHREITEIATENHPQCPSCCDPCAPCARAWPGRASMFPALTRAGKMCERANLSLEHATNSHVYRIHKHVNKYTIPVWLFLLMYMHKCVA